ncbi:nitrogen regulation protein NR(II) [Pontixanthobacter gangjinensis]|uniref:histidine kinase n=1 Tax=Pontixanthobacter gangjinensis TaxID=1028742 RepID=A0A6I4SPA9_9SPHN|nr:ATP-binding protein [Pontixanthobacter gangjinensis]MXO56970.1 PAS domain-containing protein [Pontixanthobacter gangjinensis]
MIIKVKPTADAQIAGMLFAVLLIDDAQTIAEANHAAEDMFGRSAARMIGHPLTETVNFLDPKIISRLVSADAQLVARGIAIGTPLGDRLINLTVSPIITGQGWKVLTFSAAGQDGMRDDPDAPTALKAPAILAHEIKNPLAAIRGAGQLLARKLGDKDRNLTSMISDEVDRIARLIDRMQQLGSNQSDPVVPINLHQSIRNAAATVRAAVKDRAELVEEFDPSLPAVLSNGDALEQVLINLLSNAVDACEGCPAPTVTVKTRFVSGLAFNTTGSGKSVRLPIEVTVSDNGPGIDQSLTEHIFDPFVTSKKNGQGLGLALVKKMVGDMGGRISHKRNDLLKLTEFRIHLAIAE